MISKTRSFRDLRNPIGVLILLAAFAAAVGCSTAESPGGSGTNMNHVLPSGSSVAGWLVVPAGGSHASTATLDYIAGGGSSGCTQCHGSDLTGGISKVSCFGNPAGCHHSPVANWATPAVHGATAKKAPGSSGFASCQICHGSNFSGGGSNVSCFPCHGPNAPHPAAPWLGPTFTHTTTNTSNAPVCARCHFPGSANNPANHPPTPAPAGTAPGCFNSTLCHGAAGAPHPLGGLWFAFPPEPQVHGNAAKATPGATTGFAYCQVCHGSGTDFAGGSSGVSCYTTCHLVPSPHPVQWRTGNTYVHTTTATGNAPVCAFCHTAGANSPIPPPPAPAPGAQPDCFNNTLCHAGGGAPHPVPFNDPTHYGVTDATFPAGCSACHDVSAPTVKSGPVCQTCHVAASPLTSLNCTSCHADPPNSGAPAGAAYPNIAGAHSTHLALTSAGTPISCDTCHSGLGAGTLNHYNLAKARVTPGDVAFIAPFPYTTGTATENAATLTCGSVSCHGAQTTPGWRTTGVTCTNCHKAAGTAANGAPANYYNDYANNFITHISHVGRTGCTTCHTALPAGTHFGTLSDKAIASRAAAATINPAFAYPSPPPASLSMNNCNTNSVGGCH